MENATTVNEKPIALALVICDQVIVEAGTNKKSLIGLFNGITSFKFPMQHPKMCLFGALTNGRGEIPVSIRCVRMDDGKEILNVSGPLHFRGPNFVVEMVVTLRKIPFETPGLYCFEIHCQDELLIEKRFNVIQAKPKPQADQPPQE